MASEPYGNLWGQYQGQLERRKVVPKEGFNAWIKRNPKATHKEFDKAFPGSLTPRGFEDTKRRGRGGGPFEQQLRERGELNRQRKQLERLRRRMGNQGKKLAPPKKKRVPINMGDAFRH
jgi:hypothetical protein